METGIEQRVHRKVGQALRRYRMIEEGDRILLAISGGIDSAVLAHVLAAKKRTLPVRFELEGCHIATDLAPRLEEAEKRLAGFLDGLRIPLTSLFVPVTARSDSSQSMNCFLCAMQRRMTLLSVAKEKKCNKIAYGHHMEDIVETLLMNMFFKAEISTMPARLELDEHELVFIRPLARTKKSEIRAYAERFGITTAEQSCPHGEDGRRVQMRNLIHQVAAGDERVIDNLFAALGRVKYGYLQEKLKGSATARESLQIPGSGASPSRRGRA